jgi:hypothetical protein
VGNFSDISWQEQVTLQLDYDDICIVQDQQHAYFDFYSTSSLKQK